MSNANTYSSLYGNACVEGKTCDNTPLCELCRLRPAYLRVGRRLDYFLYIDGYMLSAASQFATSDFVMCVPIYTAIHVGQASSIITVSEKMQNYIDPTLSFVPSFTSTQLSLLRFTHCKCHYKRLSKLIE